MKRQKKNLLSLILCGMLFAAMAFAAGCGNSSANATTAPETEAVTTTAAAEESTDAKTTAAADEDAADLIELGEGKVQFSFSYLDADGNGKNYLINTDEETVGAALVALGLIEGEDSEYGLYVKTVDGITADYDTDGSYWAFYIDGEYAATGVDQTPVTEGSVYVMQIEK